MANVMHSLETGQYVPDTGWYEKGLQAKLSFGQPVEKNQEGANHGGHQVVQPKRMMVQLRAQPLTGDSVTYGDSMRESRSQKENKTGLPDRLKAGIESLSGYSMDDVRVHYNSEKPAQLQALAYAQGTDIHVGPGQEKHLPHEAWHVVQQKQGRVKPTVMRKGGVKINEDKGLEKEADMMGAKVLQVNEQKSLPIVHKNIRKEEQKILHITPPVQLLKDEVYNQLEKAGKKNKELMKTAWKVAAVSDMLSEKRVWHRIGGSLAARLHGAPRTPNDLDIEVPNNDMLDRGYRILKEGYRGDNRHIGSKVIVELFKVHKYSPGFLALITMEITTDSGMNKERMDVDMVNENSDRINENLVPPSELKPQGGEGGLMQPFELVMNYLDRITEKPLIAHQKNDGYQIKKLLKTQYSDYKKPEQVIDICEKIYGHAVEESYPRFLKTLANLYKSGWE
ncbi:MAG: DUF4157 domain-containing protein [Moorea sp. SIO3H5]|nr:DUF4157 domain-containing protein [Moorena sp. SIO3H5]